MSRELAVPLLCDVGPLYVSLDRGDMLTHKYRYNQYAVFEQQFHRLSSAGVALDEHVPTEDDGFGVDIVYPLLLASTLRMKALLRLFTYDVQSCRLLDAAFQGAFDRRSVLNTMFWYSPDVTSRLSFFEILDTTEVLALLRRDVWLDHLTITKARDFVALHPKISRSLPDFCETAEYLTAFKHAQMILARRAWSKESHHLYPCFKRLQLRALGGVLAHRDAPRYLTAVGVDIWRDCIFPLIMDDPTCKDRNAVRLTEEET